MARSIYDLRKSRSLTQTTFAQLLGVRQSAIARWEGDTDQPKAPTLLKLSELAAEADRQWWRDRAAEQAGFDPITATTFAAQLLPRTFRTIPLIKNPRKVGILGSSIAGDIEQELHFPSEWFPDGGTIQAVRVAGHAGRDLIAMVDVSRWYAERLVGEMVAVRTAEGIEICWLGREEDTYLLLPFRPGQTLKLLRHSGEGSIVGPIRWLGSLISPAVAVKTANPKAIKKVRH